MCYLASEKEKETESMQYLFTIATKIHRKVNQKRKKG